MSVSVSDPTAIRYCISTESGVLVKVDSVGELYCCAAALVNIVKPLISLIEHLPVSPSSQLLDSHVSRAGWAGVHSRGGLLAGRCVRLPRGTREGGA